MNIVFEDQLKEIGSRYLVLELDTFWIPELQKHRTAYCVLDSVPLDELQNIEAYTKVHADIIRYYKQRYWTYCEHAIEGMRGRWAGALDSFYNDLLSRVREYKDNPPPDDWDGSRIKTSNAATALPPVGVA